MKKDAIQWEPKKVKVEDLIENPKNPKTLNKTGKKRLQKSLSKFGLAGTIICNSDLTIIDGHSRKQELIAAGIEEVYVSMPSRALTDQEYKEFNAIIDLAQAGDPNSAAPIAGWFKCTELTESTTLRSFIMHLAELRVAVCMLVKKLRCLLNNPAVYLQSFCRLPPRPNKAGFRSKKTLHL
jgi:hypothetical protein